MEENKITNNTDKSEEQPKHAGGRPLKFESVEALQMLIDRFFASCDPHLSKRKVIRMKVEGGQYIDEEEYVTEQQPYTISGLALALNTNRRTLLNYQDPEHFSSDISPELIDQFIHTITRAKARCEEFNERLLLDPNNRNSKGATFNLTNNFGWSDKQEIDHTTLGKEIKAPIILSNIDVRNASAEAEATDGN